MCVWGGGYMAVSDVVNTDYWWGGGGYMAVSDVVNMDYWWGWGGGGTWL